MEKNQIEDYRTEYTVIFDPKTRKGIKFTPEGEVSFQGGASPNEAAREFWKHVSGVKPEFTGSPEVLHQLQEAVAFEKETNRDAKKQILELEKKEQSQKEQLKELKGLLEEEQEEKNKLKEQVRTLQEENKKLQNLKEYSHSVFSSINYQTQQLDSQLQELSSSCKTALEETK